MGLMLELSGLLAWWKGLKPIWRYSVGILALVVIGGLVLIYKLMERRTVDPLEKADARAEKEQAKREEAVKAASENLKHDLDQIRTKADRMDAEDDRDATQQVKELTSDRKALAEAAARVGRGEPL